MSEVIYGQELEDAYDLVEEALRRKVAARNSDEFLVWYVKKYLLPRVKPEEDIYGEESADLNKYPEFHNGPPMSSLLRKRREIQNSEGRFPPSKPEIAEQRGIKEQVILEYYGHDEEKLQDFRENGFFQSDAGVSA